MAFVALAANLISGGPVIVDLLLLSVGVLLFAARHAFARPAAPSGQWQSPAWLLLFAVTLAGLIVLCWLLLRPDDPPLDVTQCALLTVFLVAVVPELFADALISHEPDSQDRLLPGFACLLWASAIYALTLALHLSADTDEPRALVAG